MKKVGMIAINRFPLWRNAFESLCDICDEVYVRYDLRNGDPEIMRELAQVDPTKVPAVTVADGPWIPPVWREECLTMINQTQTEPCLVLCPDEDEVFGDGIKEELEAFIRSDKQGMMFLYEPLETDDGRSVNDGMPYPPEPHMKVFKWKQGVSYLPYQGAGRIAQYQHSSVHWNATTKIRHYAAYTKGLQAMKHWRSVTPTNRGVKPVTLLGFGPSSSGTLKSTGEIWSLNNCYQAFEPATIKRITRVFEMHTFGPRVGGHWDEVCNYQKDLEESGYEVKLLKNGQLADRNLLKADDGRYHITHLRDMAIKGHRVIMQEPHPDIPYSEAYPFSQIVEKVGVNWFTGTPCYMLAMAIAEGYTHITAYGLDQLDWEHTLQRECFVFWMGMAHGAGIKLDGSLTFLKKYTKRYGYDYGPEFCSYQENLLWEGHPVKLRYKIQSRAATGKLFDGKK